jgi:hypothetical protein
MKEPEAAAEFEKECGVGVLFLQILNNFLI